jgi:CHAD domain-containing protein/HD superfamily phosphodiesterase
MLPASAPQEKKAGLAYWASRVLDECDKASAGFAADPVHDLRVAIRRCRSMADGFLTTDADPAWKQMKRLAKPLFASLGELRDAQVMLEWVAKLSHPDDPVGASLSAALLQKEIGLKAAAQHALASFDRKHWASLNAHLAKRVDRIPLEGLVFQHLALERWIDARELHRRALRNRSGVAYHQLRIGIKRFRYTVENFLPQRHANWAKDLRDLQDALGEVHDLDVLRVMIRSHPELPADERQRWYRLIFEERQKRLDLYRGKMMGEGSLWEAWRSELPSGPFLEQAAMEKLRTWASSLDPDSEHSARVTRFALELYDGLCKYAILTPSATQRRVLEAAAILHEVGRSKAANGDRGHQKRGYKAVAKLTPPLGWSAEDMHSVAVLVRYHRGALPVTTNSSFVGLTAKQRKDLLPIIGVLRLANAFDAEHEGNIVAIKIDCRNDEVAVYAEGLRRISRQAERIARARYLLEIISRQPIAVRPLPQTALSPRRPKAQRQIAAVS